MSVSRESGTTPGPAPSVRRSPVTAAGAGAEEEGATAKAVQLVRLLPGFAAAAGIAAVSTIAGAFVPVVGAPVIAIVTGIIVAGLHSTSRRLRPGLAFTGKQVLQGSIVVLGLGMSLRQVVTIGESSLPVLLGTLAAALVAAWLAGRMLRLRADLNLLIGIGTAICGASAIAATNAVIVAGEAEVSYAIATIFTFNVVAVLLYPSLGHLLGLSQRAFGLWAGTAINDTSSVVAASTIYGHATASYAVVVKLTRTLAIIPICLGLTILRSRVNLTGPARQNGNCCTRPPGEEGERPVRARLRLRQVFPMFIVVFVAAVMANTFTVVPAGWHPALSRLATWMITAALAAIGLSTEASQVRRAGFRPILLGAILWITVGVTSLLLQTVTGTI